MRKPLGDSRWRDRERGLTILEVTIASGIMMIFFYGVCGAVDSVTNHAQEGRKATKAIGDNFRVSQKMFKNLMSSIVTDPENDLKVFDSAGVRVPDVDTINNTPILAQGPVVQIVKKMGYRLQKGRVIGDDLVVELRRDDNDINGDGRIDQLIMIEDPSAATPKTKILANSVHEIKFSKEGLLLKVDIFTYGSVDDQRRGGAVKTHHRKLTIRLGKLK